ncbi:MAG: hypothetical protein AB4352_13560 [Hormoscilla sp.]
MSSKFFQKIAAAVASAALSFGAIEANQAQAASLIYDFTGSPAKRDSSLDFTEGGITVRATGSVGLNTNPRDVVQTASGLGVFGGCIRPRLCEDPEVDGWIRGETLLLRFDSPVRIHSAMFSRVGFNDEFTLFVDGDELVSADIRGGNGDDTGIGFFNFTRFDPEDRTAVGFGFTVTDRNDDYMLRKIRIETVPEPALVLGLLAASALGALALQRQHK